MARFLFLLRHLRLDSRGQCPERKGSPECGLKVLFTQAGSRSQCQGAKRRPLYAPPSELPRLDSPASRGLPTSLRLSRWTTTLMIMATRTIYYYRYRGLGASDKYFNSNSNHNKMIIHANEALKSRHSAAKNLSKTLNYRPTQSRTYASSQNRTTVANQHLLHPPNQVKYKRVIRPPALASRMLPIQVRASMPYEA